MTPSARVALVLMLALGGVAAVTRLHAFDLLSDLGISQGRAREAVFDSFASGTVSIVGNPQIFKSASNEVKVAIVKTATTLARTFVESDDFARRYADLREANAPDPLPAPRTADEILAKQRSDYQRQVTDMRAMFDQITPAQKAVLEKGFEEMFARLDAMETDGTKAQLAALLQEQRDKDLAGYNERMQAYEREFPKTADALVAMRLKRFLETTTDIDFAAKLVEKDGRRRFVDPGLEARPAEWKLCFRAGKAATQTARDFAQSWLKALETRPLAKP